MNNPLKKKKTIDEKLAEQEYRVRKEYESVQDFVPRLSRLCKLYPDVIIQVDLFISKRIILKSDVHVPTEFLCSCKLLGMRVKEVKTNTSYSEKHKFYMSIDFYQEVTKIECDES